jgi:amino acid transporter
MDETTQRRTDAEDEREATSKLEEFGYRQELKRALSFWDLVVYGLIFMVPIAPFGIYGFVFDASGGMVALAYLIGMVGMIFTAFSYAQMAAAFPVAGSVYAYAGRGIHDRAGFLAGWAILLDYVLVPALLYIVGAAAMASFVPAIPAWAWVLAFIAVNTTVNYMGIENTARFNRVMLVGELIVLAIFLAVGVWAIASGLNGASFSLDPLYNADRFSLSLVLGAVSIAVLSFLGFDGISTLSEEVHGGGHTIGRATVTALLLIGVLFIAQTWVAALIVPDAARFESLDTAFYDTAGIAAGEWLKVLTAVATALAWGIANALVAQAATSRLLFSMARDRKLPRFLAHVHPVRRVPTNSMFLVAGVSVLVGLFFVERIALLTSLINFGALFAFLLLHASVIIWYTVRQRSRNWLPHLISPLLGLLIIGYVWISTDVNAKVGGFTWLAIGLVVLVVLTLRGRRVSASDLEG